MITLIILVALATAAWLYAEAYEYSEIYCKSILSIQNESYEAIINHAFNSPALKLARQYTIGCAFWLALAATILLQVVVAY